MYSVTNNTANADFGTAAARAGYGVDGSGVGIGIIDTGINPNHEQFDDAGKIVDWFDAIGTEPTPVDGHGHGTHVAGTAAGSGTGGVDAATYQGVASGADLYIARALNDSGFSVGDSVEDSVAWRVGKAGVDIISMSLGDDFASDGLDVLSLLVNAAVDAGKIVVVAAGNDGDAPGAVSSPGAAEKAITVGAVSEWSGTPGADNYSLGVHLVSFSSRGPTLAPTSFIKPDIAAPGLTIMSAKASANTGYETSSGTSMATPFAAGTIALMLEADPTLTYSDVAAILKSDSSRSGTRRQRQRLGVGTARRLCRSQRSCRGCELHADRLSDVHRVYRIGGRRWPLAADLRPGSRRPRGTHRGDDPPRRIRCMHDSPRTAGVPLVLVGARSRRTTQGPERHRHLRFDVSGSRRGFWVRLLRQAGNAHGDADRRRHVHDRGVPLGRQPQRWHGRHVRRLPLGRAPHRPGTRRDDIQDLNGRGRHRRCGDVHHLGNEHGGRRPRPRLAIA